MKRVPATSTDTLLKHPMSWFVLLHKKPEAYWIERGEKMAFELYTQMAERVPAYAHFLQKKGIRLGDIITKKEYARIPIIDKDTYLRSYPLADLSWKGNLTKAQMVISATSGSTGEPFYFPRTDEQDMQYAALAEMYLRNNFSIHKKSTLYIIGWGMGIWIGGVFSYSTVRLVATRGSYSLSVITPGTNQDEIIKAVQKLGPLYDQVIIGGYPPMIKDLIDEGARRGVLWKQYNLKFIFSAEGFSEQFRDYIIDRAFLNHPLTDTLNHYGTVDLGTMAHETPVSILIRRLASKNPSLNMALFGETHRQPTLAQYIPELFYFEEYEGRLLCSARSGLPLVRYDLKDTGGIKTFQTMQAIFAAHGIDLSKEIQRAHIHDTIMNVPFVYVFERSDFTVKLSGANIYAEEVRRALEHADIVHSVTGKCTIHIDVDEYMNQKLIVHIELKKLVTGSKNLEELIQQTIMAELIAHNSEYAYLHKNLPIERMTPRITLWSYGNSTYFSATGKHRWVRK